MVNAQPLHHTTECHAFDSHEHPASNTTATVTHTLSLALPVSFRAVSRPLELSLQSTLQLSLTVLVCYRSRGHIKPYVEFTTHLGCTLKQPDSKKAHIDKGSSRMGLAPAMGSGPLQGNIESHAMPNRAILTPQVPSWKPRGIRCWAYSSSFAVTKEILVSFFSTA